MSDRVAVIPAYRAAKMIRPIVEQVLSLGLPVIVVDDGSADGTSSEARKAGATVVTRPANGGKGASLREGFAVALRDGYDWVLTLDADGQHLPREIPRFLEAAERGEADLILGNRMSAPKGMPLGRRLTNGIMSWLLSRVSGQRVPDTQCGFRLISRSVLERILLTSDRFEIDSEVVVKTARAGFRIASVPVSSVYIQHASFIRPFRDTIRFLRFLRSVRGEGG